MFLPGSSLSPLRAVAAAWTLAAYAGCASSPSTLEPCASLDCLKGKAVREVRTDCLRDLLGYEQDRERQSYINARYRYPLISSENYRSWRQTGGDGPSPQEWCRDYAEQQVYRPALVWTMSSGD